MAELFRMLSAALPGNRFRPCEAVLPVDAWCVVPSRLRFGLPWPWVQSDEAVELVDGTGAPTNSEGVAVVMAPRSDGAVFFSLWRDDGSLEALLPGVGRQIATSYRGTLERERRVLLGGSKAVVVTVLVGAERTWRLVAEWSGHLLHGELRVPATAAEGYLPHLETMLATWSWG